MALAPPDTGPVDIRQSDFAAVVEIESRGDRTLQELDDLRKLLVQIGATIGDADQRIDFEAMQSVHFMRWAVLLPETDLEGEPIPGRLLLSTNFDGGLDAHLDELIAVGGEVFHEIYGHCAGYPAEGSRSPRAAKEYLLEHRVRSLCFYVGAVGRSVAQIRWEKSLREAIEEHLDDRVNGASLPSEPKRIHGAIREFVEGHGEFAGATEPLPKPPLAARLTFWAMGVPHLFKILVGLIALGLSIPYLRSLEESDPATDMTSAEPDQVRGLVDREDYQVQNQMTSLAPMKPGRYRLFVLKTVLSAISFLARHYYNKGHLGSITTIHFARWMAVDDDRNLLFLSNYDGSWESYLADFIDKAAIGLTAIWSNTYEFPRARWLALGGAREELPFKAKVRKSQVPTEVWYSAYPLLSIGNVINNAKIREGLAKPTLTDDEAREWLARL